MAVRVKGDSDRRVTQALLHYFRVYSRLQKQGGVRMAQVMGPNRRQVSSASLMGPPFRQWVGSNSWGDQSAMG